MKKLISDCCKADVKKEVWISKEIRRIYYCQKCGQPCRVKKEKGE